jgi:hypothetical protein
MTSGPSSFRSFERRHRVAFRRANYCYQKLHQRLVLQAGDFVL